MANKVNQKKKVKNVTFPKDLKSNPMESRTPYCKDKTMDSTLKQILKLVCTAAIGVIGNSDSGFIFNSGGNTLSLNRNDNTIQYNHDPLLNAIEFDIGMPTESLQVNATEDYLQRLQFIEALRDEEDDDWSFVPEKILTHHLRKTPRWIY